MKKEKQTEEIFNFKDFGNDVIVGCNDGSIINYNPAVSERRRTQNRKSYFKQKALRIR